MGRQRLMSKVPIIIGAAWGHYWPRHGNAPLHRRLYRLDCQRLRGPFSEDTYLLVKQHVHCEQRESISVNGVSHPVQTYQVIELVNASVRKDTKLEEVIPGLSLAFDPSSL